MARKQVLTVEMVDGTVHEVTVLNGDRVAYDKAAMLNDWHMPDGTDNRGALTMQSYLAWHRMQKLGLYDKPFGTFNEDAVDITSSKLDDAPNPTQLDPSPGD